MQKTNECRCKPTLFYTRFSIRSRRFRKQIPQAAKKKKKKNLFPYENTMVFWLYAFIRYSPFFFVFLFLIASPQRHFSS